MANILYRGSAVPSASNTAGANNAPLTNDQIDKNLYALNTDKLDKVAVAAQSVASPVTFSNNVTISGNLTVDGTTTTINATTISVDDINIELGSVAVPTNTTANGGGITLKGASDKTFNWYSATSAWTSSEHLSLAAGKNLLINGATSGAITFAVPAVAGTNTITFQAATGTVAHLADIGNGTITVNTSSGLTGSGSFTTNQAGATTVTLSHADTSSVADLASATNTFIAAETYDTFGHVLTRTTGTVDFTVAANYAFQNASISGNSGFTWGAANTNTTQAADSSSDTLTFVNGGGINLYTSTVAGTDAILIEHSDTSSVTNLASDNAGNTFIQDISFTFDTYGHVTAASVATGSVTIGDATLTLAAGNAITLGNTSGANTFSANTSTANTITVNHADTSSVGDLTNSQNTYISGITFDTYGHVQSVTRNSVIEYDTLATVTGRGASTSTACTFSGGLTASGGASVPSLKSLKIGTYSEMSMGSSDDLEIVWGAARTPGTNTYTQTGISNAMRIVYGLGESYTNGNLISFQRSTSDTSVAWDTKVSITNSGDVIAKGNITAQSDIRVKTNIEKITDALQKVEQISGYTYDRTDAEMPRQTGVIAQEVLKILPEAVCGNEDSYTVAYGNMVGLLVEAIKELNAKVENLQNQLANK